MRVLGIETSCDETAAAVYDGERGLLSHCLYSQVQLHAEYGGVVPELASRDHVRKLLPLIQTGARRGRHSARADRRRRLHRRARTGRRAAGRRVRSPAAWPSPGDVPAVGVHHLEGHLLAPDARSRRRPSFRSWRCWCPAATRCSPKCAAWATTRSSAPRSTMPPARRSTRRRSCSGCRIPAGRRWRSWPSSGRPGRFRVSAADARSARARFQLQRAEDRGRRRDARPASSTSRRAPTSPASFSRPWSKRWSRSARAQLTQTGLTTLVVAGGVGANQATAQRARRARRARAA